MQQRQARMVTAVDAGVLTSEAQQEIRSTAPMGAGHGLDASSTQSTVAVSW